MVKQLMKSIREFKLATILTPTFVVGEVIIEALIPFLISLLINDIKAGCDLSVILGYAWKLVVLSLLSLLCGYLAGIYCAEASTGFARNLRYDIFTNIQKFSFSNIDKFSSASLVTRLTTDIQNVQMAFMMIIRTAVRAPLNLIFSFTMAYIMGGSMAVIFLIIIPFLGIGLYLIVRTVMPVFKKGFPLFDKITRIVEENVKGIRVVKSFVREEYEINKFDETSNDIRKMFTRAEQIIALNNPLMQISIYAVMLFVLMFGSEMIIKTNATSLDVGQLSTLMTYGFQILSSLMMLSMVFVMITFSEESCKRIVEVLNEKSSITSKENAITEVKDGSIDFDHVRFKYSRAAERPVLEDIDVHIKSGETIGIIGGTGSAKSSFVQLIPRLYDVTEGTVRVGKEDVRNYDLVTLRDSVAMVLQKNVLFSGTIADNIRWGNKDATLEEVKHVCHLACADEFIEQMPDGYDTWIEQGGTNVSGGQKQRLCIARALLKQPKILIMDDSTSAVDTKTDAIIRKAMKEYIPETTKIIIAQRTSSVEDADRIIVLDSGKIDAIGTSEELLKTNQIYREVYLSQNKQGTEEIVEEGGVR
ncbi:ABC transporter ATP-binding protein [Solobacterium moorei]|uniref:ABC transporter ATP-binding protein n=1 Tax=Solobacterium moorei TaxID=102148 RepID=UPI0024ACBE7C|nr:ABC transporter ATP-binding protein [Solobacterium moorei]MDI6414990.1 ABC transporter ATP-binding protein [Solobacterium moorei]